MKGMPGQIVKLQESVDALSKEMQRQFAAADEEIFYLQEAVKDLQRTVDRIAAAQERTRSTLSGIRRTLADKERKGS